VETFGTSSFSDEKIAEAVRAVFDFTPKGIIRKLNLLRPVYQATAAYGHFGRNEDGFTWEKTDSVTALRKKMKISS
jgi:S-adenosylmethionine synthetase